jgi:TatD DNase family protein
MLIDTHCHLNFKDFDNDRAMIIGNAKKAGIKQFVVPGDDWKSSIKAVELSQKYLRVIFAAVGFHPYEAEKEPNAADLAKLIYPTVVAIGECGLDYHMYKGEVAEGKKYRQIKLFEAQLKLALKHKLPVIIHCRDAFADIFSVLDNLPEIPTGVLHCFSGGLEDLRMVTERGLYVGIDGNVTYSKQLGLVIPQIPKDRLLLETDTPYLTPVPHRSERNEPKYLILTAKSVAGYQKTTYENLAKTTTENAYRLFHFSA